MDPIKSFTQFNPYSNFIEKIAIEIYQDLNIRFIKYSKLKIKSDFYLTFELLFEKLLDSR